MPFEKGQLSECHKRALRIAVRSYDPHRNVRNGSNVLAGILQVAVSLDVTNVPTLSRRHGVKEGMVQCWIAGYEIPPISQRRIIKADLVAALQ